MSRFLRLEKGKVVVDWRAIKDIDPLRKEQPPELYNQVVDCLLELDIVSLTQNNNFALTKFGLSYNPRARMSELFFRRQEDAVRYREAYYHKSAAVVIGRYDLRGVFSRLESI